jgi:hypothetical protein
MLAEPTREMHGLEICQDAGLPSGTTHPILARLERLGWLSRAGRTTTPRKRPPPLPVLPADRGRPQENRQHFMAVGLDVLSGLGWGGRQAPGGLAADQVGHVGAA